jgi:hypothetical protein
VRPDAADVADTVPTLSSEIRGSAMLLLLLLVVTVGAATMLGLLSRAAG